MNHSLQVKGLCKSYRGRQVVKSVSLDVESGQVIGLLGPNGAGKTTTFYMVVGIVSPEKGGIELDGQQLAGMTMAQRSHFGLSYLPQEPSVFRKLTVEENVLVALEAHKISGPQKRKRLSELLVDFSIEHIRKSYGYSLSGGERRRVEIARSLAGHPKFLLLDEPFAGVDPIAVGDIQNIIRELKKRGIGVLITDHNVRETLGICDFGYIMKEGEVEVKGTAQEIASSETARKFYLGENFKL